MPRAARQSAAPAPPMVDRLVMVETRQIRPYHRNPRRNEATVAKLVELIPKVGFNVPLLLDRQNVIVKGHTRWKAAIRLGMRAIPCVYTDADEETNRLDRLADNRVQEFSSWDKEALGRELGKLDLGALGGSLAVLDFGAIIPELRLPGSATAPAPELPAEPGAVSWQPSEPPDDAPDGPAPEPPPPDAPAPADEIDDYIEAMCPSCGHIQFVPR